MARQFTVLYLLIVLTLAAVSWGEDRLLQMYGGGAEDRSPAIALDAVAAQLQAVGAGDRKRALAEIAARSGGDLELFASEDIAGRGTLEALSGGRIAYRQASAGETWALRRLDDGSVLALKYADPGADIPRSPLEWAVTVIFYASIALVVMLWIWPLRRDLRALESAAARFGNRNWSFDADIGPRSQVFALAETFRKMAARIDGLIASHKHMSNAVSHEIKTPLARMQFEIELAQRAAGAGPLNAALEHIKADIAAINELVTSTLSYAILERADLALNLGTHDFTELVPALAAQARATRPDIRVHAEVRAQGRGVACDRHLMESVFKNLLYNAVRHARAEVRVVFEVQDGSNRITVDDDGPGIPEQDRARVFESFVQLDNGGVPKSGFGLGLAIVKRALEWHGGEVTVTGSPLGGARFCARWPATPSAERGA